MTLNDLIRALSGLRVRIDITISGPDESQPVTPIAPDVPTCRECGRAVAEADLCERSDCPYYHLPGFMQHGRK